MTAISAIDAARNFLTLVWDGEPPENRELLCALDHLVIAYYATADSFPADSEADPPRADGAALWQQLAVRFPAFGLYPMADPAMPPDDAPGVGDAVDDLVDLTIAMRETLWRAEHLGVEDAIWYFRLDHFHWGRHARELGLYLHARIDWS